MKSKMVKNGIMWGSLILALVSANAFANNKIMIEKLTSDKTTAAEFEFVTTGLGYTAGFKLNHGEGNLTDRLTDTTFTVREVQRTGWKVSKIECNLENLPGATVIIYNSSVSLLPLSGTPAAGYQAGDDSISITFSPIRVGDELVECIYTNTPQGGIKIVKKVNHQKADPIPSLGWNFAHQSGAGTTASALLLFPLGTNEQKTILDAPVGANVIYEFATLQADDVTGLPVESSWDVESVDCTCIKADFAAACLSTWAFDPANVTKVDLNKTPTILTDDFSVRGKLTVTLAGGEFVQCIVTNKDAPCPTVPTTVNVMASSTEAQANANAAAGPATPDVSSDDLMGGCSSTGTGIAGLSTILLLLSSLMALRFMRRVRVKNER